LAPVLEPEIRQAARVAAVGHPDLDRAHDDELVGVLEGQRPDGDSVDDAENRAVDADSEGEAEDGESREAGTLDQSAGGETQVVQQRFQLSLRRRPRLDVRVDPLEPGYAS